MQTVHVSVFEAMRAEQSVKVYVSTDSNHQSATMRYVKMLVKSERSTEWVMIKNEIAQLFSWVDSASEGPAMLFFS